MALQLVLGDVYAFISSLPNRLNPSFPKLTISLGESLAQSLDVAIVFTLDHLSRATKRSLNVLVVWSFDLPLLSTLQPLLIVLLFLLLVLFHLGLQCFDLFILTIVGLLLLGLLSNPFVEAETGSEGADDCRNQCRNDEGFFEVFLLEVLRQFLGRNIVKVNSAPLSCYCNSWQSTFAPVRPGAAKRMCWSQNKLAGVVGWSDGGW